MRFITALATHSHFMIVQIKPLLHTRIMTGNFALKLFERPTNAFNFTSSPRLFQLNVILYGFPLQLFLEEPLAMIKIVALKASSASYPQSCSL